MCTLDLFKNSRSYHEYKEECITKEQMKDLMTAGLCAPSSNDEEPWHLVGIMCKDTLCKINDAICEQHQDKTKHFYNAPCAILVAVDPKSTMSATSAAVATQNILLAAECLKLASCWIDGVLALNNTEVGTKFKQEFNIPAHYEFYSAVALGYRVSDLGPKNLKENRCTIIE